MSTPIYYDNTVESPENNSAYLAAFSGALGQALATLSPIPGDELILNFAVGSASSTFSQIAVDGAELVVTRINDNEYNLEARNGDGSSIQIGDSSFLLDAGVDGAITSAATLGLAAVLGLNPASITAVAIAGGVGFIYNVFIDPITEPILDILAGTIDVNVQLRDPNGQVIAGALYRDGLGSTTNLEAVENALITLAGNGIEISSENNRVVLDSAFGTDEEFLIHPKEMIERLAETFFMGINGNVDLDDAIASFRNFQSNDAFVAVAANDSFIFARNQDDIDLISVPADDGSSLIQGFNPSNIFLAVPTVGIPTAAVKGGVKLGQRAE